MKFIAHAARWFVKAHAYAFFLLRSTFKMVWDDGWEDWKALLVMSVATSFFALTLTNIVSICLQHRILMPQAKAEFLPLWGTVVMGVTFANYHTLVFAHRWSRFEPEFRLRPKATRIYGGIAVWLSMILIIAAAQWTGSMAFTLPAP